MKNYEISTEKLRDEISTLKKKSKTQISNNQNQIEEMKIVFDNEKKDLVEVISL